MKHQQIGEGEAVHEAPAIRISLSDVVAEYDAKLLAAKQTIEDFHDAWSKCQLGASIGGAYGGTLSSSHISVSPHKFHAVLLSSAWRHVYNGLQIDQVASAKDRKRFEMLLNKPDPFTLENLREQFGDYLLAPRFHILKGLAECFTDLDPAYKSHAKVKIGVEGLPKRIIVANVGDHYGYGYDKVKDVLRVLDTVQDRAPIQHPAMLELMKQEAPEYWGVTIKRYMNGNAHLIFDKITLRAINQALAEFYGEVLADSPEAASEHKKRTGTALSTDLAYYPTPAAVIEIMIYDCGLKKDCRVLEPSCGDGRIMEAVIAKEYSARVTGVEVHHGRAAEAQAKGLHVMCENFLNVAPSRVFDVVLMNPPFSGKHYQKHIEHAKRFLVPGGTLTAILPGAAHYDHGFVGGDPADRQGWVRDRGWCDLPVGSFKESGTNIPTGIYTYQEPRD